MAERRFQGLGWNNFMALVYLKIQLVFRLAIVFIRIREGSLRVLEFKQTRQVEQTDRRKHPNMRRFDVIVDVSSQDFDKVIQQTGLVEGIREIELFENSGQGLAG